MHTFFHRPHPSMTCTEFLDMDLKKKDDKIPYKCKFYLLSSQIVLCRILSVWYIVTKKLAAKGKSKSTSSSAGQQ